jgi:hypothetical protein
MSVLAPASASAAVGREGRATSPRCQDRPRALSPRSSKGPGTNPEQLFAGGYSACFGGAIGAAAGLATRPARRGRPNAGASPGADGLGSGGRMSELTRPTRRPAKATRRSDGFTPARPLRSRHRSPRGVEPAVLKGPPCRTELILGRPSLDLGSCHSRPGANGPTPNSCLAPPAGGRPNERTVLVRI